MVLEMSRNDEDELYEAASTGSVEQLNTLIQKDPRILLKLSLTNQTETPLHISALLGRTEFANALLKHNAELARRVDSAGRTPLHFAAAKGHKETVRALSSTYRDACLSHDEMGRIPLHYAAMRGEVETVKILVEAKPESVYVRVECRSKETVLHLCVKYNQLECLKVLVEKVGDGEFLKSKAGCDAGATILNLAMMLRQIQTIRYLLSLPVIRAEANSTYGMSLTTFNVLEYGYIARDDFSTALEIQQMFLEVGIIRGHDPLDVAAPSPNALSKPKKETKPEKGAKLRWYWTKFMTLLRNRSDWLDETRGMLMVVATMITTMTFQAVVNPPGGVWQENNTNSTDGDHKYCSEEHPCFAGTAVFGYIWKDDFFDFVTFNTISFLASLSVTLLLISGFPLHNRVCMWLLSMAMCLTLTFVAITYLNVLLLVVPYALLDSSTEMYKSSFKVWIGLLVIVGIIHTVRFLIWVGKKSGSMYFRSKTNLQKIVSGFFSKKALRDHSEENNAPAAGGV